MRVIVIMAGGSGERFWPLSRRRRPKQMLALAGEKTMLASTVERAEAVVGAENVYIVAGPVLMPSIEASAPHLPKENFLTEPVGKNTAPCLAFAAGVVACRYGPDCLMGVMTADHLIRDIEGFAANADLAFDCADRHDRLMTIGIQPTHANTGFGYLELGETLLEDGRGVARRVKSFREKPDEATAQSYLKQGNFLWNSGMFFWKVRTLIEAFEAHCPELAHGAVKIGVAWGTEMFRDILSEVFDSWPSISIDYAVMEKAHNVAAVASRFDWDDVGTWSALARIHEPDEKGNLAIGNALSVDSTGCIIHNQRAAHASCGEVDALRPLVATLGVEDLIVVVSDGTVLVCRRDREQDIKQLLKALREEGHEEYL